MSVLKELDKAMALLSEAGIILSGQAVEGLEQHLALVRERNAFGGLVSREEVGRLESHVWDSLGLAPYVRGKWLDIGPGGGFPFVPVALVGCGGQISAVERSSKKAGVLIGMLGKLGLVHVEVVVGEFPAVGPSWLPDVITARAVERPEVVWKSIASLVEEGSTFLCQSDPTWWRSRMFHVEHIQDAWQAAGFRRGELFRITRAT